MVGKAKLFTFLTNHCQSLFSTIHSKLSYINNHWSSSPICAVVDIARSPMLNNVNIQDGQKIVPIKWVENLQSRVEWFRTFFLFLKTGTMLRFQYTFMSPIPKNRRIWPCAQQSFHFKKITGTLTINIYFWKFANPFLLFQRKIANKKIKIKYV